VSELLLLLPDDHLTLIRNIAYQSIDRIDVERFLSKFTYTNTHAVAISYLSQFVCFFCEFSLMAYIFFSLSGCHIGISRGKKKMLCLQKFLNKFL
jgi:hypothetical protein